jgi:DNA-binding transcriptional ArsR family regulator
MNIPHTTLLYHLKYFKKLGIINEKNERGYRRIYIEDNLGTEDKEILSLLRQKIPCRIIIYLFYRFSFSRKELIDDLNESPSNLSYYINKLLEKKIIEEAYYKNGKVYPFPKDTKNPIYSVIYKKCKPVGREKYYRRKSNKVMMNIYKLLITHKHSLADKDFIENYLFILKKIQNYNKNKGQFKRIVDEDTIFELIEELIKPFFAA